MSTPLPLPELKLLRHSVGLVWLGTALVSVLEWRGQGTALLHSAGVWTPWLVNTLIGAGAAADGILGVLLCVRPARSVYLAAIGMMLVMTVVATYLLPALWLHPLGPLLKNLPIAAALWLLWRTTP